MQEVIDKLAERSKIENYFHVGEITTNFLKETQLAESTQ